MLDGAAQDVLQVARLNEALEGLAIGGLGVDGSLDEVENQFAASVLANVLVVTVNLVNDRVENVLLVEARLHQ